MKAAHAKLLPTFIAGVVAILMLLLPPPARAELSEEVELCLGCHNDPSLEMEFPGGHTMSVYVDPDVFAASVHGDKLNCTDCHSNISDYPHPEMNAKDERAYSIAQYESCKRCHFANYTKTLESIHFKLLSKGDLNAPICVDCHGAHDVTRPDEPRARVSQTCNQCHSEVYDIYSKSVHGKALLEENNQDVPVCTDCHQAHNIEDPRTTTFLATTPELCGGCHANEKIMSKYGISTKVLDTYLEDFHGVSVRFSKGDRAKNRALEAVCTDCHGVHDIATVTGANSRVIKANLLQQCRSCHPDASENFPDAWLSHYEPSPKKAALVYYVRLFYKFFIPFTIIGLGLHIVLHIWRVASNR